MVYIPWKKPALTKQVARGLVLVYGIASAYVESTAPSAFSEGDRADLLHSLEWIEKLQRWVKRELP